MATASSPDRLRVLVVEDNGDAGDVLALMLRLWGHEVEVVRSGTAALEAVRAHRPDVALVDILVPGLDGYQLAERLRAEHLDQDTVLFAMTGLSEEACRRRSLAMGFREHFIKPMDPLRLRDVLSRLPRRVPELAHT
jgi:CheY-like chemotaxis protein